MKLLRRCRGGSDTATRRQTSWRRRAALPGSGNPAAAGAGSAGAKPRDACAQPGAARSGARAQRRLAAADRRGAGLRTGGGRGHGGLRAAEDAGAPGDRGPPRQAQGRAERLGASTSGRKKSELRPAELDGIVRSATTSSRRSPSSGAASEPQQGRSARLLDAFESVNRTSPRCSRPWSAAARPSCNSSSPRIARGRPRDLPIRRARSRRWPPRSCRAASRRSPLALIFAVFLTTPADLRAGRSRRAARRPQCRAFSATLLDAMLERTEHRF